MNRKQELIEWLIDDVTPRIRQSGNARAELLKFANEKNLSPAELEAMGQLFNTAKTIKHLEKSANRGETFPIIDVPDMVDEYLQVEKKAALNDEWFRMTETNGGLERFPDDIFALNAPKTVEDSSDEVLGVFPQAKAATVTPDPKAARLEIDKLGIEQAGLNQAIFDANEDNRDICVKWARQFRQFPNMDFARLEADAIKLYGDSAKTATTKIATYIEGQNHIKLARAQDGGQDRLVDTRHGFTQAVREFLDRDASIKSMTEKFAANLARIEGSRSIIKQAITAEPPPKVESEKGEKEAPLNSGAKPKSNFKKDDREEKGDKSEKDKKDKEMPLGQVGRPPNPDGPDWKATPSEKSPFKTVPDQLFSYLEPAKNRWSALAEKALTGGFNSDQAHVDQSHQDAQSAALLQNLLTTDEVLSEADPEKVVSAYNTIRQTSPGLAGDINVMRMALRSAIQHDGLDPSSIKGFADTELSRQKVEKGIKEKADQEYKNKAPKPSQEEKHD